VATKPETGKPVILFHGDKGGVGKSWACSVFADFLVKAKISTGLVDGDTRNPDVSRMFGDLVPVVNANLRVHEGWMDLTDFMISHSDRAIAVSMPAGIGGEFRREAGRFFNTVKMLNRPVSMFWVINRLPDSINLLSEALSVVGDQLHSKVVVKNLFFGDADKFSRWEHSETRQRFEKAGGQTITLTELHERTVDKLFADNETIMPFSSALVPISDAAKSPHKLTPSENMELDGWLKENHRTFEALRPALAL
jgi:hypothetical protein